MAPRTGHVRQLPATRGDAATLRGGHCRRWWRRLGLALVVALVATGCGGDDDDDMIASSPAPEQPLELTSSAFDDGGTIPVTFTCEGDDVSPPLSWGGVPDVAEQLALVAEDPDAPSGVFVHWAVAGIDPATDGLHAGSVPEGVVEGTNDFGDVGYGGPCPPAGDEPHRYVFTLFALQQSPDLDEGFDPAALRQAVADGEVARGELTGSFGR